MTAALRPRTRVASFLPGVTPRDPIGHYWLSQVTLHLRRELCWLWQERTGTAGDGIPPLGDKVGETLDLSRYAEARRRFFRQDPTARFLTDQLEEPAPRTPARKMIQGSFGWVVSELGLAPAGCFVLALGLQPVVDSAAGLIYAACANDPSRTYPTMGLAHRLWDAPDELLGCFDPTHPLVSHGLLSALPAGWQDQISVHPVIVRQLLGLDGPAPEYFVRIPTGRSALQPDAELAAARLSGGNGGRLRIVPLAGSPGADLAGTAARIGKAIGRVVVSVDRELAGAGWLRTLAWLRGVDLFFPLGEEVPPDDGARAAVAVLRELPIIVYPGLSDAGAVRALPHALTLPAVTVPPLEYQDRLSIWRDALEGADLSPETTRALPDIARRFRIEAEQIRAVSRGIAALGRPAETPDLVRALSTDLDLGELAQRIVPRFRKRDLMLPPHQTRQLDELIQAMGALATVHYEWGLGRAWNEAGLSALFAGPPGTGKTMAAEVIAGQLDLPLFRIDLSQVVNKYIGETEKNLRRLFDAAEGSDVILFFDEAESLFGKRTETKDAHDRYANLEVSYLLGRMERFRGHAILCTNRKKDLDEAFMRRLRFVVDFPLPEVADRLRMWTRMLPRDVDISKLDLTFLAERFPLAGGHIRAIVLHASLQAAAEGERILTMPVVLRAVHREYEKLERSFGSDQLGRYAEEMEA
jgi:hypothetical protein